MFVLNWPMFAVCVCVNLTLLFRHVYPADAAVSSCVSSWRCCFVVCIQLTLLFRCVYPADAAVSSCVSSWRCCFVVWIKRTHDCRKSLSDLQRNGDIDVYQTSLLRIDRTQNLGRHWQCMWSQHMLRCCCRSFHHEHRRSLFHSKSASTDVIIHFRRAKAHGKRIWRMLRRFKFIFECSLYKR